MSACAAAVSPRTTSESATALMPARERRIERSTRPCEWPWSCECGSPWGCPCESVCLSPAWMRSDFHGARRWRCALEYEWLCSRRPCRCGVEVAAGTTARGSVGDPKAATAVATPPKRDVQNREIRDRNPERQRHASQRETTLVKNDAVTHRATSLDRTRATRDQAPTPEHIARGRGAPKAGPTARVPREGEGATLGRPVL